MTTIIRILGRGQVSVDDAAAAEIEPLDQRLHDAVDQDDHAGFATALGELHQLLEKIGQPVPVEHFGPSDLVLPGPDASLAEVQGLLATHEEAAA